ncbi:MAG: Hsp70 family protein, partial [Clostridia bacterium]
MNISIDIGTSSTSACVIDEAGQVVPVALGQGNLSFSIPSAIFVSENGEMQIGELATSSRMKDPRRYKDEFKRNLGEKIPYQIGGRSFLPEELYTEFFVHIKKTIEKLYEKIDTAYITHPATFNNGKKELLIKAAKMAGLFNAELIDEPSSAAMYYCSKGVVKEGEVLLVYDFGGGTFDASVVKYENERFKLLATPRGLERCGGIDIDQIIARDIVKTAEKSGINLFNVKDEVRRHRIEANVVKTAVGVKYCLSGSSQYSGGLDLGMDYLDYELSRDQYNLMIARLIDNTISCCSELLGSANIKINDISAVAMVGGTSKIPLVEQMVRQFAKGKKILTDANMELAVAKGGLAYSVQKKKENEEERERQDRERQERERQDRERKWRDEERERQLKEQQQNKETPEELFEKGCDFYFGRNGKAINYNEAFKLFKLSAEQGCVGAQNNLGFCYENGQGVAKNLNEAFNWYKKSAEQGDADAQNNLGCCYENSQGVAKNLYEAFNWYKKSAEQGNANGECNLGVCYGEGRGVIKSQNLAFEWFKLSAEQGNDIAQNNLGICYNNSRGVAKNLDEAFKWFKKSAEQGNAEAQYNVGVFYHNG